MQITQVHSDFLTNMIHELNETVAHVFCWGVNSVGQIVIHVCLRSFRHTYLLAPVDLDNDVKKSLMCYLRLRYGSPFSKKDNNKSSP